MDTLKTYGGLYQLFDALNAQYFDGELDAPFITVGSGVSAKTSFSGQFCGNYFSTGTQTFDCDIVADAKDAVNQNETGQLNHLMMSAEFLARPIHHTAETMLHEMVHLYCFMNDIKDTSNNGVYHNKKFKQECECRDLTVDQIDVYGWVNTRPTQALIDFVNDLGLDESVFHVFIPVEIKTDDGQKVTTKKRYICPECGQQINAPKDRNIVCGECMKRFDYWDITFEDDPEILMDYNNGFAESMGWASHVKDDD